MGLETGTYISDLVATNPTSTDPKSQGDDHIRLLKSTVKATFPNVTGAVTGTQAELNILDGATVTTAELNILDGATLSTAELNLLDGVTATTAEINHIDGVTSPIQTQLDAKADIAGETYSGTHDFTGGTINVPTTSLGDNSTKAASTAFCVQQAFLAALPAQTSDGLTRMLKSLNGVASWGMTGISRTARTSNTALATSDNGNLIDITSGTFTQTFTAAATLTSGWYCYIRNSGTGDITLDPNGSETIDGLTSFVMYPGESRLVVCDGTAFYSIVLTSFYRTFTSTATFNTPPGYKSFGGYLWGAGASGTGNSTNGGGGGGGACNPFMRPATSFGATETVTIGAGGVASSSNGNAGGTSSIGTLVYAYGGGAPNTYPSGGGGVLSAGGGGGSPYGGLPAFQSGFSDGSLINSISGSYGGGTAKAATSNNARGQHAIYGGGAGAAVDGTGYAHNSIYGGAGGGTINSSTAYAQGSSVYGGNGGAASTSTSGTAGTAPGGGGGASMTSTSGAGARGELRIWGVI